VITQRETHTENITLSPNYNLPVAIILLALPLVLVNLWLSIVVAAFGLFLIVQATTIRLCFTTTALEVYRSDKMIRKFPYTEWLSWQIFWNNIPILFYFREVKSIHFLPIIFDQKTLKSCLEQYCTPKEK
jgi:hypothetical protein